MTSCCSSGSPPVISTRRQPSRPTSRQHVVDRHLAAAGERVRRVAPAAAQIAGREPHERARAPDVRRFALHGQVDLVDRQHRDSVRSCHARVVDPHRDVRLELSERQRHVERRLLSVAPAARLRRARLLRGALRHGRGELDVLPACPRPPLSAAWVRADAAWIPVRRQAVPEVHAPRLYLREDRRDATGMSRAADLDLFRARHRPDRRGRPAGGDPAAVSAELSRRRPKRAPISTGCSRRWPAIPSPWSCAIAVGATTRPTPALG